MKNQWKSMKINKNRWKSVCSDLRPPYRLVWEVRAVFWAKSHRPIPPLLKILFCAARSPNWWEIWAMRPCKFPTFLSSLAARRKFLRGGGGMSDVGRFGTQNEPKIAKNEGKWREMNYSWKVKRAGIGHSVSNLLWHCPNFRTKRLFLKHR